MNLVELNMIFKFLVLGPVNLLMLHYAPSITDCGATVVQFRPGRQISNLKTQVQILAVAFELKHDINEVLLRESSCRVIDLCSVTRGI
jgi:hypothetical protein